MIIALEKTVIRLIILIILIRLIIILILISHFVTVKYSV